MSNDRKTSRTPREIREQRRRANQAADTTTSNTAGSSNTSAASRAEAAGGARAAERIKERKQAHRRQRVTVGALIAIGVLALIALAFIVVNTPAEAPIPAESAARYEGLQQNRTDDGYPRLGDPRAPIQVTEFSSFDCPTCATIHDQLIDALVERVRTGKMSLVFVPLSGTGSITNGRGAAIASVCAAEQNHFWELHDTLFSWQQIYGNQAFTNNRIESGITALGLNSGNFGGCVRGGGADETIRTANTFARTTLNPLSTPAFTINGVLLTDDNNIPLIDPVAILENLDQRLAEVQAVPNFESTPEVEATVEATTEATAEATESADVEATSEAAATEESPVEATVEPTEEATPEATDES